MGDYCCAEQIAAIGRSPPGRQGSCRHTPERCLSGPHRMRACKKDGNDSLIPKILSSGQQYPGAPGPYLPTASRLQSTRWNDSQNSEVKYGPAFIFRYFFLSTPGAPRSLTSGGDCLRLPHNTDSSYATVPELLGQSARINEVKRANGDYVTPRTPSRTPKNWHR